MAKANAGAANKSHQREFSCIHIFVFPVSAPVYFKHILAL